MEEKKRSCNFTSAEKKFLFELIAEKHGRVLEDKKTDRASLVKREETWKVIEKEFNAVSPSNIYRGADSLKKLYTNRKKEVRKRVAEEKKEVLLTGGGPASKIFKTDDDIDNILLSIMNEKTVYGLTNPYDCDNTTEVPATSINTSVEFVFQEPPVEINLEHAKQTSPEPAPEPLTEVKWPNNLKIVTNPLLEPCSSKQVKSNTECSKQNLDGVLSPESSGEVNWKSYTPNDLKRSKNPLLASCSSQQVKSSDNSRTPSRRRPTSGVKTLTSSIVAQKYDLLLDKRLVLVEKQIKQVEDEHNLNVKKKNLEIELLQLELISKKKELGIM